MEKTDVVVIGAGVVGLAIARRCAEMGRAVVVVEQHDGFGRETSSRNSEVIHAGLYYPPNSLKAQLCVRGNALLYEACQKQGINYKPLGKIVVASCSDEEPYIEKLYKQGSLSGVQGLQMLTADQITQKQPGVFGTRGLWSPTTGIVDSHGLMKWLEQQAIALGATVAYCCFVKGICKTNAGYEVTVRDTTGEPFALVAPVVINSAGLSSDTIAALAGIDIDTAGYRLHPCKGEYFSVSSRHRNRLNHLVYPAPTRISLGVHAVVRLDGSLKLGPNAYYVDSITDYSVNPAHQQEFFEQAHRYLPFIEYNDLTPDMSGIRPKLQSGTEAFHDFVICQETARGLPGFINLIGMESPALTSCLAIAEYVGNLL